MRRPAPLIRLFALIAALLALEPLLHQHSLERDDPVRATAARTCSICAMGAVSIPSVRNSIAPPTIIVERVAAFTLTQPGVVVPVSLASRAPPAL